MEFRILSLYRRYSASVSVWYSPSLIPAGVHEELSSEVFQSGSYVPIKASLAPRSAPAGPCPRNGSIIPGESKAYTRGFSRIFILLDRDTVTPGLAPVRTALGVPNQTMTS